MLYVFTSICLCTQCDVCRNINFAPCDYFLFFSFRWYHGKLDRTIAEERLRQARNPGSYLIRESDRRPGSFVLSFLSVTNVVNHFRYVLVQQQAQFESAV